MIRRLLKHLPPIETGGLIPAVSTEHRRSTVDGSTVHVRMTWLRIGAAVELDLPFGATNPDHETPWRPW